MRMYFSVPIAIFVKIYYNVYMDNFTHLPERTGIIYDRIICTGAFSADECASGQSFRQSAEATGMTLKKVWRDTK